MRRSWSTVRSPAVTMAALLTLAGSAEAQDLASLQISPSELRIRVGETGQAIATGADARGNPLGDITVRWSSNNVQVARVEYDESASIFATVHGVAPGFTVINADAGDNIRAVITIVVEAAPDSTPAPPDTALAAEATNWARVWVARIDGYAFGSSRSCRAGGFVGPSLLVTSYRAIRGADSIVVHLANGTTVLRGVRVATWDAARDLAVLQVPVQRTGGFAVAANDPAAGDAVWIAASPRCDSGGVERRIVNRASPPAIGQPLPASAQGAVALSQTGELLGILRDDSTLAARADVAALVNDARTNLAASRVMPPQAVALAESHAYGSLRLESDVLGAVARITPLEPWHWESPTEAAFPVTYLGPMGRYRIDLLSSGAVRATAEATIGAGVNRVERINPVAPLATPDAPPNPEPRGAQITPQGGGGGFPVALALLGIAGGGAAAFFLLSGDSGPGPNGNGNGNGDVGGVRIIVNVP